MFIDSAQGAGEDKGNISHGLADAATTPRIGLTVDNLAVAALLALSPILLAGILLIGFRWPAKYAMPIGLVSTLR